MRRLRPYAANSRAGKAANPCSTLLSRGVGSPTSMRYTRRAKANASASISMRAKCLPAHRCTPCPQPSFLLGYYVRHAYLVGMLVL